MNLTRLRPYYDELLELPTKLVGGPYHDSQIASAPPQPGQSKPPRRIWVKGKRSGRREVTVVYERIGLSEDQHVWVYSFLPGVTEP